jgi:alpha-beta hydrolase superfamily lysophospholipase
MALIALSMGAVIAATWTHDHGPQIRCFILAEPALQVKRYVSLACAFL